MDKRIRTLSIISLIFFIFTIFFIPITATAGNFGNLLGGAINQVENSGNNSANNVPNAVKTMVNQMENSAISALAAPKIFSVSPIYPTANQRIVISGTGFGTHIPFNGDSRFIRIYDVTRSWNAGWSGNWVTIHVTSWSNNEIIIDGFTRDYGGTWSFQPGDQVEMMIWNPQLATMINKTDPQNGYGSPGMYDLTVTSQQSAVMPSATR